MSTTARVGTYPVEKWHGRKSGGERKKTRKQKTFLNPRRKAQDSYVVREIQSSLSSTYVILKFGNKDDIDYKKTTAGPR